nr:SoxR reducing system RseC family protein [Lysobacter sp. CAU 1642]
MLRARGGCTGCTGCAGRCGLGWQSGRPLRLPREQFDPPPRPGEHLILRCEAVELRDRVLIGYGLPLAGLLAGGLLGAGVASFGDLPANLVVAFGAVAGTLSGLAVSKHVLRPMPSLRLLGVRREPDPQRIRDGRDPDPSTT